MNRNLSLDSLSTESDIFFVDRSSEEGSPISHNTPNVLNSTELSAAMATETITISSVASPDPLIVTTDSDSNEPTFPKGFGNQHPIMPPSLNDLNLPHNPFNVLATMAVIRQNEEFSPQTQEPSIPSPIPTPLMDMSTIEGWGHRIQPQMTIYFVPKVCLDGSAGIFLLMKQLTPMSPDKYLSFRARPPHRRLHHDK